MNCDFCPTSYNDAGGEEPCLHQQRDAAIARFDALSAAYELQAAKLRAVEAEIVALRADYAKAEIGRVEAVTTLREIAALLPIGEPITRFGRMQLEENLTTAVAKARTEIAKASP